MDYQEVIDKLKPELDKTIEYLKKELAEVRTSRASTSLVDFLEVDCFGKRLPLKSLAMITLSDKREVLIQPWDISYIEPIEKALRNSSLELSPVIEQERIRVPFPPLTEDLRKKMVRLLAEKAEEVSRTVRHLRNETKKEIDLMFDEGEIGEDDKFRARKKLDELIGEYNQKIDEMVEAKKKEILD
jgi:ribosome recycling factor